MITVFTNFEPVSMEVSNHFQLITSYKIKKEFKEFCDNHPEQLSDLIDKLIEERTIKPKNLTEVWSHLHNLHKKEFLLDKLSEFCDQKYILCSVDKVDNYLRLDYKPLLNRNPKDDAN